MRKEQDGGQPINRPLKIFRVIVKTNRPDIFMACTLIDNRNDAIKCSKLGSETIRLRLVVPLKSMVYKNADHEKVWSICFYMHVQGTRYFPRACIPVQQPSHAWTDARITPRRLSPFTTHPV